VTERRRRDRWLAREDQLFLFLTIAIGIAAGLTAVLFSLSIEFVSRAMFGVEPSTARLLGAPIIASLIAGILLARVVPDARGSGVPQTKTAYHLSGGAIPARVPIGKFVLGVLTIGSGHSLGREGPSVQIGAGLASVIGRWLRLSPQRRRDLIPVGAAGALAAAFNTPVAAVLFALEEIIGDMNAPLLGSTVVAAVAAVIVERSILGNEPLFRVPAYQLVHPAELVAYAVLGIAGGIVSLAFCTLLLALRRGFARLPAATRAWQPAIGGLAIGGLLLVAPAVMGVGYDYVDQALNGGLVLRTMLLLCAVKLVATAASYASGNAGGIFAPSLYIGAMLGGAIGIVVHGYAPFATAEPGAYALVGMGTLFAGIIRAPLTSVFMIFEITQDYQILVPLMIANMLSFLISRRYQPVPVYDALLRQDNIHLPPHGRSRLSSGRTARDLMVPKTEVVAAAPAVHVHPDHSLDVVIERFGQADGDLPVVSRANARQIEGTITMEAFVSLLRRRRGDAVGPG
jgi:CIC family chloride channel protein